MPKPEVELPDAKGWRKQRRRPCACWDCLRSRGITPKKEDADKHRDINGNIYNVVTGEIDWRRTKQEREEAKMKQTAKLTAENRPERG